MKRVVIAASKLHRSVSDPEILDPPDRASVLRTTPPGLSSRASTSTSLPPRAPTPPGQLNSLLVEEADLRSTKSVLSDVPSDSEPQSPSAPGSPPRRAASLRRNSCDSLMINLADLPPPPTAPYPDVARMLDQYRGEERGLYFGTAVKYLNETERLAYKITVKEDGKLYDAQGQLFDTAHALSALGSVSGKAIFVMDSEGNFYASNHQPVGKFHHSSFLAGDSVAFAGELDVCAGELRELTPRSGHYRPTSAQQTQALNRLSALGVKSEFKVEWAQS